MAQVKTDKIKELEGALAEANNVLSQAEGEEQKIEAQNAVTKIEGELAEAKEADKKDEKKDDASKEVKMYDEAGIKKLVKAHCEDMKKTKANVPSELYGTSDGHLFYKASHARSHAVDNGLQIFVCKK